MKKNKFIYTLTIIALLLTGCGTNSMPQNEQPTAPSGTMMSDISSTTTTISADDARKIALEKVPGATTEHISKLEMDYDNGRQVYDGEIHYDQYEYDFEIDAISGAILEWDAEPIKNGVR